MPTSPPAVATKLEQPLERNRSFQPLATGAVSAAALLIVFLTMGRPWHSSTRLGESSAAIATDPTPEGPAPLAAPVERIRSPKEITKTNGNRPERRATPIGAASIPARPTVVRARLCAELDDWQCDPTDRPVPAGPLFFYTQVKSTSATTITHRWYRGNRLYHAVDLRVQASPSGYRAYSRHTMTRESAGKWRIELRAEDGALLHEEHFSVR